MRNEILRERSQALEANLLWAQAEIKAMSRALSPSTGRRYGVPKGGGIHAAKGGNRFEALGPIRQGVRECFRVYGPDAARRWNGARTAGAST